MGYVPLTAYRRITSIPLPALAAASRMKRVKGWLLVLTLANLALANALGWYVVAMGWPK
jgi:hypothetical protein